MPSGLTTSATHCGIMRPSSGRSGERLHRAETLFRMPTGERDSDMMEALFWKVLGHLQELSPGFGPSGRYRGLPRRFKRAIHAIDSTTIALVANCMDWAKHRRRKAAAKMHLRLNLQSFLPGFAVIEEASHHDDTRDPGPVRGAAGRRDRGFRQGLRAFCQSFPFERTRHFLGHACQRQPALPCLPQAPASRTYPG